MLELLGIYLIIGLFWTGFAQIKTKAISSAWSSDTENSLAQVAKHILGWPWFVYQFFKKDS